MNARSAVERLTWHYQYPFAQAIEKAGEGTPVAGMTSNTVPWELLRAAGYFPLMLNPARGPLPLADRFMEDGVFAGRVRGIFEGLASGAWPFLNLVMIPRTSEQEHKLFLYLREMTRQRFAAGLPDLYLYNLLHARSPEAERYGLDRTRELKRYLEDRTGRSIEPTALAQAVCESNRACQAIGKLRNLRERPEPQLTGAEALALIGAAYFMDRTEYARLAAEAVNEIAQRPPARGARLLVKGTPLHHTGLHRAIEAHRAVVVGEDDWWGSRAITKEITAEGDALRDIFETYYRDVPSPRVFPRDIENEWFLAAAAQVEGVVFYLPPEDDVLGWEYPGLRKALDQRGIPSLLVREEAVEGLSPEGHQKVEEFVSRLSVRS